MSQDPVHQFVVEEGVYERWCCLGTKQGFHTDSQIAAFLLDYYEDNEKKEPHQCCISCQRILPHICHMCGPTQQATDNATKQEQLRDKQQQVKNSSREVEEQQMKETESQVSACHQSNTSTSPSLIHGPCGSVFRDVGKLISARKLVHCAQNQQLFTNVYPVTKEEIQAGKFSLVSSSDRHRWTAPDTDPPCVPTHQTNTDTPHLSPGQTYTQTPNLSPSQTDKSVPASQTASDHVQRFVTDVATGQSYPVRIFQIDDVDKVVVGAMFASCVRETCLVTQPATQKEDSTVRESEQSQKKKQGEASELDASYEDTGQEEDGGASRGSGEGEQKAKGSDDVKPQLSTAVQNRQPGYNTTRKTWGRPPYLCQKCGTSFNSTSSLTRHILKHTGERPFPCPECKAAFATRPELTVHFRKHTGEKPFLCPICGSAYDRSSNLHTHLRTHTGERPFKCDQCNGGFTTSSSLTRHKRIHTGEKPYVCNQCSAAFPQLGHLKEHLHRHTGIKPYQCQQCDAAFSTMSRLRRHHRKVQCAKQ